MPDPQKPSRTESPPAPLRVGVAGLTRHGIFHIESLALRRGFTPVAAAGSGPRNVDVPGECRLIAMEELIQESLDLAIIATSNGRVPLAGEFLARGTSVLIESGLDRTESDALEECLAVAGERGLFCGIWQPELAEPDYLAAKSVAESAESGEIRSVRLLQHGLAPGLHSIESAREIDVEDRAAGNALAVARRRLLQLLELVGQPVSTIQMTVRRNGGLLFQPGVALQESIETAVTVHVEFASGATGLIDIDIAAAASLNPGWNLQTTRGGCREGRQFFVESDGEVYDVPITPANLDPYSTLEPVLQSGAEMRRRESERSVKSERIVARLIAVADSNPSPLPSGRACPKGG